MSISAINSNYSYFQKYQNQFFGGSISETQFESLLRKYGIVKTGDAYKDVEALYKSMSTQSDSEAAGSIATQQAPPPPTQSQSTDAQNSLNIPWVNLMSRVGLSATGVLTDDYNLFKTKISSMQASAASSPKDKAYIAQLSAEADVVFVQPQNSQPVQVAQQPQEQQKAQALSGADIKAMLNRLYFFS